MTCAARKKGWSRKQKRLAVIAGLGAVAGAGDDAGPGRAARPDRLLLFADRSDGARGRGRARRSGSAGWSRKAPGSGTGGEHDFVVTDGATEIAAHYIGILPDLFREGQGVVAEGSLAPDGQFAATNVLAKHDENYMPKEVVEALKARGEWQREGATQ